MKLNLGDETTTNIKLKYGDVLILEKTSTKERLSVMLVFNQKHNSFPCGLLNMETSTIVNNYDSLSTVEEKINTGFAINIGNYTDAMVRKIIKSEDLELNIV